MTSDSPHAPIDRLRAALAGQYTVDCVLGQGGMGTVYLGRDDTLHRPVAIKVISGDLLGSAEARARFLTEARVVARLRHPNIVTVYSAGETDGLLWFAMEYVPGESLRDLLARETRVAPARVERTLHELAHALDSAHASGIVHRDVKPENILLDRETGRAMLSDFGVARAVQHDDNRTGTGFVLGSPRYMSPEQASGDRTLDGRSDLYALALVGYEMITGQAVVQGTNVAAMLVKQLTEPAPPLRTAVPDAPVGLAEAIDGALAKAPDDRWPDGRSMAAAIGLSTPLDGVPASGASQRVRAQRRLRRIWTITSLAAVLVAAAGGWWWMHRTPVARALVVLPFEVPAGVTDVQWLHDGAVNMLTLALGQWQDLGVTGYERTLDLVRGAGVSDGARVSLAQARNVARAAAAGTMVMGQITATADSLIIVARRYRADGTVQTTATAGVARAADPRRAFDRLATALLGLSAAGTSAMALAGATTSSLEAYQVYLRGLDALNRWQLDRADSLFTRAVRLDTTFSLAWHKRGLARGWNGRGDSTPSSAEIAVRHAGRLPPRERQLVEGHRWLWVALGNEDDAAKQTHFVEAVAHYRSAVALDSSSAEAWYGLADGVWHFAQFKPDSSAFPGWATESRLAFERALSIDPGFHLAYSHLVDLHSQMATTAGRWLMVGDVVRRATAGVDTAVAARARRASRQRAIDVAARWTAADPEATRAWGAYGGALSAAGRPDSAARVYRMYGRRGGDAAFTLRLQSAYFDFVAGAPSPAVALREAVADGAGTKLRATNSSGRQWTLANAVSVAAGAGDSRLVDDLFDTWNALDSTLDQSHANARAMRAWWRITLRAAMGAPLAPDVRRSLLDGTRRADDARRRGDPAYIWARSSAYAVWMLTGDTAHAQFVMRADSAQRMPELRAAMALRQGDTVAARTLAAAFPPPAQVRGSSLGLAGLRTVQRAEVLAALGDLAGATANYQAIAPARFSVALVEPGLAVYVRTLLRRAELEERLGQRAAAVASLRELLSRWSNEDPLTRETRAAARVALARLGDPAQSP